MKRMKNVKVFTFNRKIRNKERQKKFDDQFYYLQQKSASVMIRNFLDFILMIIVINRTAKNV